MSVFDPETFMQSTLTEANSTVVEQVPPGEYTAIIKEAKPRVGSNQASGEQFVVLDVTYSIMDDNLKQKLGREELIVKQGIFLDVTDAGALDMGKGKNVGLGRLREALGKNDGPFRPAELNGAGPLKVSVQQDKKNPEYTRVAAVGRMN
jgi:hypothetical protein